MTLINRATHNYGIEEMTFMKDIIKKEKNYRLHYTKRRKSNRADYIEES